MDAQAPVVAVVVVQQSLRVVGADERDIRPQAGEELIRFCRMRFPVAVLTNTCSLEPPPEASEELKSPRVLLLTAATIDVPSSPGVMALGSSTAGYTAPPAATYIQTLANVFSRSSSFSPCRYICSH